MGTEYSKKIGAMPSNPDRQLPTSEGCGQHGEELSVAILLWPAFPLMSLTGIVESLRHAGDHGDNSRQRYTNWNVLGPPNHRNKSSCGISVPSTSGYSDPGQFDYVFVIGGLLSQLDTAPDEHRKYIHAASEAGVPIIGVCTGSFVLAQEKLLNGHAPCVHAFHHADFDRAFPGIRRTINKEYELSNGVGTVLGGICILSLMSHILGCHFGPDRSAKMIYQMSLPGSDTGNMAGESEITDARVQKALVHLDTENARNPRISELAQSLGLSERHFHRLFRDQVGTSPKDYLIDMKLKSAVWRLRHTTRSITSIAYSTGFSSAASLADHCQKRLNATPTDIRRRV